MKRTILALTLLIAGAGFANAAPYHHNTSRGIHAPAARVVVSHRPVFFHNHHRIWHRHWR